MIIEWGEFNSVNVKSIDEQHQKLLIIINKFFVAGNNSKEAIKLSLEELVAYANYHFKFEEELFDKFQYEKSVEHKEMHEFYQQKVAEFQKNIEVGDYKEVFTAMSKFLREWWIFHVNKADSEYSDCFNVHGLY